MLSNLRREVIVGFVDIGGTVNHHWLKTSYNSMRKWWCRLCTWHHSELDFYSASSLKQQSAGRDVASLEHIIMIPRKTIFALSP